MAFNDFLKKVKDTASNTANSAKNAASSARAKMEEGKNKIMSLCEKQK